VTKQTNTIATQSARGKQSQKLNNGFKTNTLSNNINSLINGDCRVAPLLAIQNLKKSFGKNLVLKGINLELNKGSIVAIMGPNGSGKTTLLKSILGLVKPDSGEINVKGMQVNGDAVYRRFIGYMPQNSCFPENLKVKEVISMLKDVRGTAPTSPTPLTPSPKERGSLLKGEVKNGYDNELIIKLNIEEVYNKQIGTLSGGTKQRVSSAVAFLFDQEIIILDEPTAGLDPVSTEIVKQKIIDEKNKDKLVIITSHVVSEVEELADRVIFLLEGNVHVDNTVNELISQTGETSLNKAIAKIMIANSAETRGHDPLSREL
jgi:Cu-processing system ATP-binding protein